MAAKKEAAAEAEAEAVEEQAGEEAAVEAAPPILPEPSGTSGTSAGASGDPAVHQLLAERQTATSNGDDEKATEIDKALADLGFTS